MTRLDAECLPRHLDGRVNGKRLLCVTAVYERKEPNWILLVDEGTAGNDINC